MDFGTTGKRAVVAMSGGVDSSVAALILKQQGYEVIGISLKLWDYDEPGRNASKTCCSTRDIGDARDVCAKLGIPFYAFNYKAHFEEKVIAPFVSEYKAGRTPNPCILCNQHVKFDRLLIEARKLGANFLATGHYARIIRSPDGIHHLLKGKDASKDQSYVLFGLSQDDLRHILFPIGSFTKEEIRSLAREHGLPTADKHESQDICFVPDNDYAAFVRKRSPDENLREGFFIDSRGKILGRHRGIHAYTVGQRRGLGVSGLDRYYVLRIDADENEIVLGLKDEAHRGGCIVSKTSWLLDPFDGKKKLECLVKIRYQKTEIPVQVTKQEGGHALLRFSEEVPGVTPGQAAVFYRQDEVLGGGWIASSL